MTSTAIQKLERRVIDLSYKHHLSHIGSCLTALPILYGIYLTKRKEDRCVLSAGHCGLALYVVLEHFGLADAEDLLKICGVHPDRYANEVIDCSTGSLGMGLSIATGMAISDRSKNVHCVISDGEAFEGVIWECSNVIEKFNLDNLKVYVNFNGWSAYDPVPPTMKDRLRTILPKAWIIETNFGNYSFLNGQSAHYHVMSDEDYGSTK